MNFVSAYFTVFKGLLKEIPWESVPRDIRMEQTWQFFKVPCKPMHSLIVRFYVITWNNHLINTCVLVMHHKNRFNEKLLINKPDQFRESKKHSKSLISRRNLLEGIISIGINEEKVYKREELEIQDFIACSQKRLTRTDNWPKFNLLSS